MYHTNYVTVTPASAVTYFGKVGDFQHVAAVYDLSHFTQLQKLYLYKDSIVDLSLANCSSSLRLLALADNPIKNCDQWFADVAGFSPSGLGGTANFYFPALATTSASTYNQNTLTNFGWILHPFQPNQ